MHFRLATILAVCLLVCDQAIAQAPLGPAFTYQGRLDQNGQPFTGSASVVFRLYDAATLGNLLGTQSLNGLQINEGALTAILNAGSEFGPEPFNGERRWLEVTVNAVTLVPRQELTAAPYASALRLPFHGMSASPTTGALNITNTSGPGIIATGGSGTAGNAGVSGYSPSSGGIGVFGRATSTSGETQGGWFQALSTQGYGVRGEALASGTNAVAVGVYGTSHGGNGKGVLGEVINGGHIAVQGRHEHGSASGYGGSFSSTLGYGVRGDATAASGTWAGILGIRHNLEGYGVQGNNFQGDAIFGSTKTGRGVVGSATEPSGSSWGVWGESSSTSGRGVYGQATATSGTSYGVRGFNANVSGYAVFAAGDFGVSGAKAFVIDHPLDPENRYLKHYCSEGPEPLNVYGGTVTTDAAGHAWVELPDYFSEINGDCRYSLTVVEDTDSDAFVHAKIAREVHDNRFKIRTSAPHVKVCWEVSAVRDDLWVRARGAPVEVEKDEAERGKFQHPELYGQPEERGIDYRPQRSAASSIEKQAHTPASPQPPSLQPS